MGVICAVALCALLLTVVVVSANIHDEIAAFEWCGVLGSSCATHLERFVPAGAVPLPELEGYLENKEYYWPQPILVDWDQDGDMDLFVNFQYNGTSRASLRYWRQDDGQFVELSAPPFELPDYVTKTPSIVDWDGDGDLDVIAFKLFGGLEYYEHVDDGSLQLRKDVFQGIVVDRTGPILAVDWDTDGDVDLVLRERGFIYFERLPNGSLAKRTGDDNPFGGIKGFTPFSASAVDWDGDGDWDVVLQSSGECKLFLRSESGLLIERTGGANPFSTWNQYHQYQHEPVTLAATNYSADGHVHIAVVLLDGILFFRRELAWSPVQVSDAPTMLTLLDGPLGVATHNDLFAIDLNRDGHSDLVVSNTWYTRKLIAYVRDNVTGKLHLLASNPFEPFCSYFPAFYDDFSRWPCVPTDWDKDGEVDLIMTNCTGTGCALVLVEGVLNSKEFVNDSNQFHGIWIDEIYPGDVVSIVVLDWDADGDNDLLVAVQPRFFRYYEQSPAGALEDKTNSTAFGRLANDMEIIFGQIFWAPVAADIDEDGDVDLIFTTDRDQIICFLNQPSHSYELLRDELNPFRNVIGVRGLTVVDWNGDGHLDVIVPKSELNGLLYYESGFCEHGDSCIGGMCLQGESGLMECMCFPGNTLPDCSGCQKYYFSAPMGTSYSDRNRPRPCTACDGGGHCSRHGVCIDDEYAAARATTPSMKLVARGNGSCRCSPFFFGSDARGRVHCGNGTCPAGMQLFDFACRMCPPGQGKRGPGDLACEACSAGEFSDGSTGVCEPCALGSFSGVAGALFCEPCKPGKFRDSHSKVCNDCPPGNVSKGAGSSACVRCAPGTYAAAGGSSVCETCETGSFSLANRVKCEKCQPGTYLVDGSECDRCPSGWYAKGDGSTSCEVCADNGFAQAFLETDVSRTSCNVSSTALVMANGIVIAMAVYSVVSRIQIVLEPPRQGSRWRRLRLVGRAMCIEDTRLEESDGAQGKSGRCLVIEFTKPHGLSSRGFKEFAIEVAGTKHPNLDGRRFFYARCVQARGRELKLLEAPGRPVEVEWSTSRGTVRLSAVSMLLLHGYPNACLLLGLSVVSFTILTIATTPLWREDMPAPRWYGFVVAACFVAVSFAAALWSRSRPQVGRLGRALASYTANLRRMRQAPKATLRGRDRAVQVGQVLDLYNTFHSFIRMRNMYYVEPNILNPMTVASQLSFAEFVGPSRAQWFVSHFWGTALRYTCDALEKHAKAYSTGDDWRSTAYWICTFSNNQYRVKEEVGETWSESSFYLTLNSGCVRGTCLILTEEALPLTRSWCLFEVLTTFVLTERASAGELDFPEGLLLCSNTGVLNKGQASVDVSMGIAKRLSTLKLQDATASVQSDKEMIDRLVVDSMGSFTAINGKMLLELNEILLTAKRNTVEGFDDLLEVVKNAQQAETGQPSL